MVVKKPCFLIYNMQELLWLEGWLVEIPSFSLQIFRMHVSLFKVVCCARRLMEKWCWKVPTWWSGKQGQIIYLLINLVTSLLILPWHLKGKDFDPAKQITIYLIPKVSMCRFIIDLNIKSLMLLDLCVERNIFFSTFLSPRKQCNFLFLSFNFFCLQWLHMVNQR